MLTAGMFVVHGVLCKLLMKVWITLVEYIDRAGPDLYQVRYQTSYGSLLQLDEVLPVAIGSLLLRLGVIEPVFSQAGAWSSLKVRESAACTEPALDSARELPTGPGAFGSGGRLLQEHSGNDEDRAK